MSSKPKIERILPLRLKEAKLSYEIFEPGLEPYVDNLVLFYTHMTIFRAFAEAKTSEQAARMLAMDTAGTNAKDLVEALQRKLNRQRQQEITQELAEIAGQRQ
ncbi:MAG: F0F1 ATP synthase subunit gamma [Fretibacterium sp.]|nr:F0F1 ATP synthase subunit gamma [Fretibacterium sp.]